MKLRLRLRRNGLRIASAIKPFAEANVLEYSGPRLILMSVGRVRKFDRKLTANSL